MLFVICPPMSRTPKFWCTYVITHNNFMGIVEPHKTQFGWLVKTTCYQVNYSGKRYFSGLLREKQILFIPMIQGKTVLFLKNSMKYIPKIVYEPQIICVMWRAQEVIKLQKLKNQVFNLGWIFQNLEMALILPEFYQIVWTKNVRIYWFLYEVWNISDWRKSIMVTIADCNIAPLLQRVVFRYNVYHYFRKEVLI